MKPVDSAFYLSPSNQGGDISAHTQAQIFIRKGVDYSRNHQYELAFGQYDQAVRIEPNNAVALNNRCYVSAILGKLQAALSDCNESLRIQPENDAALDSRGFTNLKLGRQEAAIADYNNALRLNPKIAAALYGRGLAYLAKKNQAQASHDISAAKEIDPNIADEFRLWGVSSH